ncbi:MAG: hypothetical protein K6D94_08950 [Clostridiales bacterium]|nr:hypothetical protein [Clostridiales bacterium]
MKKALFAALAAASVILSACGGAASQTAPAADTSPAQNDQAETTAGETEAPEIMPDLPEMDFGGAKFVVISPVLTGDMADANTRDIKVEEENGENLNDAVYRRNIWMLDTCNIVIDEYKTGDCARDIKKSVAAGDSAFDLSYALTNAGGVELARKGYFLDYNTLPYIDFSQPWWDSNASDSLGLCGKNYMAVNDIMLSNDDATSAVLFNKKMLSDYGFTDDMYEVVTDNKWTLDKVAEMSKSVYSDLDGNGVWDENDRYGFMGYRDASLSMFHSSGGRVAVKDGEDSIRLTMMDEGCYSALEAALTLMAQDSTFNLHKVLEPKMAGEIYPRAEQMFRSDQSLFYWILIHDVQKFRDMESDFGILPVPSTDPERTGYNCNVNWYHSHMMSVVSTADPERAGYVTELMAAKSHYTVHREYLNVCLARKYSRDNESEKMLDLVFGRRVYDIGAYYAIGSIAHNIIMLTMKNNTDAASMYAKAEKSANKDIEKIFKDYGELG